MKRKIASFQYTQRTVGRRTLRGVCFAADFNCVWVSGDASVLLDDAEVRTLFLCAMEWKNKFYIIANKRTNHRLVREIFWQVAWLNRNEEHRIKDMYDLLFEFKDLIKIHNERWCGRNKLSIRWEKGFREETISIFIFDKQKRKLFITIKSLAVNEFAF